MADTTPASGNGTAADDNTDKAAAKPATAAEKKAAAKAAKANEETLQVKELRALGHDEIADKVHETNVLHAGLVEHKVRGGVMREMTDDEAKRQNELALDLEERELLQVIEYGTFIATGPIEVGNARAFNEGDPVPVTNVELNGYEAAGKVRRVATKEA